MYQINVVSLILIDLGPRQSIIFTTIFFLPIEK